MKKKLTLKVEQLSVDQFQVEAAAAPATGTVQGYALTQPYSEPCRLCPPMPITYSCEDTSCC